HHQVVGLKTSLDQRDDTISTQEQEITTLQVENEHLSSRNQWLERQMKLSQIHRFGSSSEKALGLQRELFNEAEMIVDRTDADQTDPDPADDTTTVPAHQRKKRSRTPTLSDDLVKAVQRELRRRMHESIGLTMKWLRSVITGHMNYYCVPGNSQCVSLFHAEIVKRWFKMLRRRSQRHRITWARFGVWIRRHLPKVRIVHPYPEMRFCAKYSK
ncbi:MAG: hypothetical protein ACI9FD_004438, partial [Gammaproteobacteria bacterium]